MCHSEAQSDVCRLLDYLEERLDPAEQEVIRHRHIRNAMWQPVDRPPLLIRAPWDRSREDLYPTEETVNSPAKMLLNELRRGQASAVEWSGIKDDTPLQVRPNFGIGLVASAFGARVEVVEDNPPWVRPLAEKNIESAVEQVLETFDAARSHTLGWFPRVEETLGYYAKTFANYPKVSKTVAIIMPDLQGPLDTATMLWGGNIFLALYTRPELVERLLKAVAETMVSVHNQLRQVVGRELLPEGFSHQHGSIIRGNIMIRCDSNLMMSSEMYARYILPYDRYVLKCVGDGSYHSCGRWEKNVPLVISADEVGSLDFGTNQSHLNNMDSIYEMARCRTKHLNLVTASETDLGSGKILERFPLGVTLTIQLENIENGAKLMSLYGTNTTKW